jgi:ferredoxin
MTSHNPLAEEGNNTHFVHVHRTCAKCGECALECEHRVKFESTNTTSRNYEVVTNLKTIPLGYSMTAVGISPPSIMLAMLCVKCDKNSYDRRAMYVLNGNSLCEKHFKAPYNQPTDNDHWNDLELNTQRTMEES